MRFTATSVLSLAAMASAAAVAPRADYGYWDFSGSVSFPASGYTSMKVDATYHNTELADPIDVSCSYLYTPGNPPKEEASCTDPSFSYDLHGIRKFLNPVDI